MSGPILARHQRNLMVLSSGRSGSSLLVNYLNCNRQIHCHGEILNSAHEIYGKVEGMNRAELLRHVVSFFDVGEAAYVGAKFLNHQFEELDLSLAEVLEVLRRPKVIVLYRRGLLETYLSLLIAEKTDLWYSTQAINRTAVPVNLADFAAFAGEQRRRWQDSMAAVCRLCPFICVAYEHLVANPAAAMAEVFRFLELPAVPVCSESLKQNPSDLRSKISNIEELPAAALAAAANDLLELEHFK
jgi:LPS sulfotransferase NodH